MRVRSAHTDTHARARAPLRTVFVSSALASAHACSIVSVDELLKSSSVSVGELLDNNSIAFSGFKVVCICVVI